MSREIEDILREDLHVHDIIQDQYDLPEFDLSSFKAEKREDVGRRLEILTRELQTHYIVDDFTEHLDRRAWQNSYIDQYGTSFHEYFTYDGLRVNSLSGIFTPLKLFARWYAGPNSAIFSEGVKELYSEYRKLITQLPTPEGKLRSRYDEHTGLEKVELMRSLRTRAVGLLSYLTAIPGPPS